MRSTGSSPASLCSQSFENAIRHGIAHCENEGLIEASARREGTKLHLRVRDSGSAPVGEVPSGGHGIGLKNTRARLAISIRKTTP